MSTKLKKEMTIDEKYKLIKENIIKETSKDPIYIVKKYMHEEYINMHGPEHHFLDGAAFLVACKNTGLDIDLVSFIDELSNRTIQMPGAMCGKWGICGSISSLGAALSIIHKTGPLSNDEFYKSHMAFTSSVLNKMSEIGGPRCCKRNAFLSISMAIDFVYQHYQIQLDRSSLSCEFSSLNQQCIGIKCPFHQ